MLPLEAWGARPRSEAAISTPGKSPAVLSNNYQRTKLNIFNMRTFRREGTLAYNTYNNYQSVKVLVASGSGKPGGYLSGIGNLSFLLSQVWGQRENRPGTGTRPAIQLKKGGSLFCFLQRGPGCSLYKEPDPINIVPACFVFKAD